MAFMSPTDSLFLLTETDKQPMHVGGLLIFGAPVESTSADLIDRALEDRRVSDFLRNVAEPQFAGAAWTWRHDTDIDFDQHVKRHQLPPGASEGDLLALCAQLHSERLDRSRPLWEIHVIEGLPLDRFALYAKIHHSVADGVAALSLLRSRLSDDPDIREMPAPWVDAAPEEDPSHGGTGPLRSLVSLVKDGVSTAPALADMTLRSLTSRGGPLSISAPKTVFTQKISEERAYAAKSWPLERLRIIAKFADCTVNDVVLTMCAGGLREFLIELGELPRKSLVAMVPVSMRPKSGDSTAGNHVGLLTCSLGTNIPDARERLLHVSKRMREGKHFIASHNATQNLVTSAAGMSGLAPMVMLGRNLLVNPPFNVVISNIPGPSEPLYWNGALLEEIHPLSIPVSGLALNITCVSQCDRISVGLTAASDVVPEPDEIAVDIDSALDELERAVGL